MNVNGGEIKSLGQKRVVYITHKVVMNVTFLVVEDVVNPVSGLDARHQSGAQFHLFQSGKALVTQGLLKGSL